MLPRSPEAHHGFLREALDYDLFSKPRLPLPGEAEHDVVELFGARFYAGEEQSFLYQVPSEIRRMEEEGDRWRPSPARRHGVKLFYKVGFADYLANHEFFMQYYGKTRDELEAEQMPRQAQAGTPAAQRFELSPAALQASRVQAGLVADPRPGQ
jgi:hypothetical protein